MFRHGTSPISPYCLCSCSCISGHSCMAAFRLSCSTSILPTGRRGGKRHWSWWLIRALATCLGACVLAQYVVQAASTVKEEPYDVLRLALYRAGLATGVVGIGDAVVSRTPPTSPPSGQRVLKNASYEALASAEAFIRDVQHVLSAPL